MFGSAFRLPDNIALSSFPPDTSYSPHVIVLHGSQCPFSNSHGCLVIIKETIGQAEMWRVYIQGRCV